MGDLSEIPFTRPPLSGAELDYVRQAAAGGLASGGPFTERCEGWRTAETPA